MASSKGIHIKNEQVGQMGDLFDSLPEKEQETTPLQQAVDEKLDSISSALKKGYTVIDLAQMLGERLGITVSPTTLSRCIRKAKNDKSGDTEEKPRTKGKKTGTKAKKATRTAASTPTETEDASAQVVAEPVTAPISVQGEGDANPEPKKKLTMLERLKLMGDNDDVYVPDDDEEAAAEPELVIRGNFSIMPKDEDL